MKLKQPESPTVAAVLDEAELVRRSRSGDTQAFGSLVRLHQDRIYHACLRMCGDPTAADDLTQETFVKAFTAISRFDGRSRLFTWLYRIAINTCRDSRRGRRPVTQSLDAALTRSSHEASPIERTSDREEQSLVLAALAELDDDHRAAVILRDLEGLDYGEIAGILEVAVGTVKSRLHRARMALREKLLPLIRGQS
jgi:RNA polymerase sigma-70 factor (ECF subfamily)